MSKLTARQLEVFQFIKSYIQDEQLPPSRTEIADHFDIYPYGVTCHLKALEKKGALELLAGVSRGIKLVKGYRVKVV